MKKNKSKLRRIIENPTIIVVSFLLRFKPLLSDSLFLKLIYYRIFGKKLNLKNPLTYNEKLQWLKLYDRKPEYTMMVDKFEVKKYVASIIGEKYLIPTIGVWDKFDDIDFNKLPEQFALKCTHDSGGNIICKDKSKLDIKASRFKINKSLGYNYYGDLREWPYKNVKPKVIIEKYMVDESGVELKDYKFFCFNGEPKILFIATDRGIDTRFDFYDIEFNHLNIINGHENAIKQINKPQNFEEMIEIARKLSQGIIHVRIDLFNINGKIYFGEMTFTHFSGLTPFEPEEWDYKMGSWISLPIL